MYNNWLNNLILLYVYQKSCQNDIRKITNRTDTVLDSDQNVT